MPISPSTGDIARDTIRENVLAILRDLLQPQQGLLIHVTLASFRAWRSCPIASVKSVIDCLARSVSQIDRDETSTV